MECREDDAKNLSVRGYVIRRDGDFAQRLPYAFVHDGETWLRVEGRCDVGPNGTHHVDYLTNHVRTPVSVTRVARGGIAVVAFRVVGATRKHSRRSRRIVTGAFLAPAHGIEADDLVAVEVAFAALVEVHVHLGLPVLATHEGHKSCTEREETNHLIVKSHDSLIFPP